jgi:hypothetical protein
MKYLDEIRADKDYGAPALEKLETVQLGDVGALAYVIISQVLTDFERDIQKRPGEMEYLESLVPALKEFREASDKFVQAIEPAWYENEKARMHDLACYEDPDVPFTD